MRTIHPCPWRIAEQTAVLAVMAALAVSGCGGAAMSGKQLFGGGGTGTDVGPGAGGTATATGGRGAGGATGMAGGGGAPGTGGGAPTGGALAAGGSRGLGGQSGLGGGIGTGGRSGSGGAVAAGGAISDGGARGSGGAIGTGGTPGTGGVSGAGGTTTRDAAADVSRCEMDCGAPDTAIRDATPRDRGLDLGVPEDGPTTGGACGATNDPACPGGTYCEWSDNMCGARNEGACTAIPRAVMCAISPAPVCGCDGQNYAGQCEAAKAGVDVSSNATCPEPTGMFRCGWSYCKHGAEYCYAQVGGAVTNPGSYTCTALPAACNGVASCACVTNSSFCTTNANGDVTVTLPVP
jgi:hypothetical protein